MLEKLVVEEVWPERPELYRDIYFGPVLACLISNCVTEKGVLNSGQLAAELERSAAFMRDFTLPRRPKPIAEYLRSFLVVAFGTFARSQAAFGQFGQLSCERWIVFQ